VIGFVLSLRNVEEGREIVKKLNHGIDSVNILSKKKQWLKTQATAETLKL